MAQRRSNQTLKSPSRNGDLYLKKNHCQVYIDLTEDIRACIHCQRDTGLAEGDYALERCGHMLCIYCIRAGYHICLERRCFVLPQRVVRIFGLREPCTICTNPIEYPTRLKTCGHVFCRDCLVAARWYNNKCPSCRIPCCGNGFCMSDSCIRRVKVVDHRKVTIISTANWS